RAVCCSKALSRLFGGFFVVERVFDRPQIIAARRRDAPATASRTCHQAIAEDVARAIGGDRTAQPIAPSVLRRDKDREIARNRRDRGLAIFRRCQNFQNRDLPTQRDTIPSPFLSEGLQGDRTICWRHALTL